MCFTLNSVLLVAVRRPWRPHHTSPSIDDQPTVQWWTASEWLNNLHFYNATSSIQCGREWLNTWKWLYASFITNSINKKNKTSWYYFGDLHFSFLRWLSHTSVSVWHLSLPRKRGVRPVSWWPSVGSHQTLSQRCRSHWGRSLPLCQQPVGLASSAGWSSQPDETQAMEIQKFKE